MLNKLSVILVLVFAVFVGTLLSLNTSHSEAKAKKDVLSIPYSVSAEPNAPIIELNISTTENIYNSLSLLTKKERGSLFQSITGTQLAEIIVLNIDRFAEKEQLNAQQIDFINQLKLAVSDKNFADKSIRDLIRNNKAIGYEKAVGLFGAIKARELGLHIGGNASELKQSARYTVNGMLLAEKPWCTCQTDGCSNPTLACFGPQCICSDCRVTTYGCGWLLIDSCDGTCTT